MIQKNFSIENCECFNNKCPFYLKYFIISLKDKIISNHNPPSQASDKIKNIDFLIKAKNDLNKAKVEQLLINNPEEYISPSIILNKKDDKKSSQAKKNVDEKNKITQVLESSTFKDDIPENQENNRNKVPIIFYNLIKIINIQYTSYISIFIFIFILFIIIINMED